jgi:hypothetical protein
MAPLLSMLNVVCQILVSVTFCHYKSCLVELLAHALSYTPDMSHEPSKRKNVSGIMLVKVTTRPTEMHVLNRKNSQGAKNLLAPGLCHFESLCHYASLSLCPSSSQKQSGWVFHLVCAAEWDKESCNTKVLHNGQPSSRAWGGSQSLYAWVPGNRWSSSQSE